MSIMILNIFWIMKDQ